MPGALLPQVPPLPESAVLLHIGVHKTGTTAMQAALADARGELIELGVAYPGRKPAHHPAALSILDRTWGWAGKGGRKIPIERFNTLSNQVARAPGRVAISSEFFCEATEPVAQRAVDGLGGERAHVVVTLRNFGRLLPSSWQQYLKYGINATYDEWLLDVFQMPGSSGTTPSFWKRHDHGAVVQRWAKAASPERVTVVILEDVDRSAQFVTFAQLLDIDPQVLVSRMNLTSNRSMTAAEAETIRRLNAIVRPHLKWGQYQRLVRNGAALGIVEGRNPGRDEARLATPDWALDKAAEFGNQFADVIAASGVRVVGDLDALRVRLPAEEPVGDRDEAIPTEAAVQALASVVMAATSADPSTKELIAALKRKARSRIGRE
jgi:hypothetical protein